MSMKNNKKLIRKKNLFGEATKKIEEELKEQIKNKENIVNKQVNVYGNQGYIEVEVIYEVLENIGFKEKIIF